MMAIKDKVDGRSRADMRRSPSLLWLIVIGLVTVFLAGVAAGYLDGHRDSGGNGPPAIVGAGVVVLLGVATIALYLRRFGTFWRTWSPRKRLYLGSLAAAVLIGFVTAMIPTGDSRGPTALIFDNGPLSPGFAIPASILWGIGVSVTTLLFYRASDDHERRAYDLACVAGFHAFVIPAPVWWVLGRAGLTSPVEAMPLAVLSVVVNLIVYLWFKFR